MGWEKIDSVASTYYSYTDQNAPVSASVLNYQIEAGPLTSCDPTRGPINTSRSNIRTTSARIAGLEDHFEDNGFYAYPNPSNGNVYFKTAKAFSNDLMVNVYDALGQVVHTFVHKANTNISQININNLSNGMYFLQLNLEGKTVTEKIMLEK